jgi:DNA-binding MarR family transcriptional regulator
LFRAARLFNEAAIARVQQVAEPRLRQAHTQLFPHLTTAGVRATDLAKKLGISKQAVGVLLDDLAAWGMVDRVPDPADRRAQLVRLTPHGGAAMLHGLTVLQGITAELESDLGPDRLRDLHAGLLALVDALERRERSP